MGKNYTVKGPVSVYSYTDNDVNGRFGTFETASGINATKDYPTAAVQMNGRDGLKLGDILLIEKGDKNLMVLVTDLGGLPHAKVDLFSGVASEELNMALKRTNGGSTYVTTLDGSNDPNLSKGYTITRVGHLPNLHHNPNYRTADGQPKGAALEVLQTLDLINKNLLPSGVLELFEKRGILQNVNVPLFLSQHENSELNAIVARQFNFESSDLSTASPEALSALPATNFSHAQENISSINLG